MCQQHEVEAYKETLASIRTHSTIRFVALPFFLVAAAALGQAFFQDKPPPQVFTALAGLLIAAVACIVEIVLSRNLIAWWTALEKKVGNDSEWKIVQAHRGSDTALRSVRWALLMPYPAVLAFWFGQLLHMMAAYFSPGSSFVKCYHSVWFSLLLFGAVLAIASCTWRAAADSFNTIKPNSTSGRRPRRPKCCQRNP